MIHLLLYARIDISPKDHVREIDWLQKTGRYTRNELLYTVSKGTQTFGTLILIDTHTLMRQWQTPSVRFGTKGKKNNLHCNPVTWCFSSARTASALNLSLSVMRSKKISGCESTVPSLRQNQPALFPIASQSDPTLVSHWLKKLSWLSVPHWNCLILEWCPLMYSVPLIHLQSPNQRPHRRARQTSTLSSSDSMFDKTANLAS